MTEIKPARMFGVYDDEGDLLTAGPTERIAKLRAQKQSMMTWSTMQEAGVRVVEITVTVTPEGEAK